MPPFAVEPSLERARGAVFKPAKAGDKRLTWADELPVDVNSMKASIPAHCFEHNTLKSFAWLIHDFVLHGAIMYVGAKFILGNPYLDNFLGWAAFAAVCGTQATGIWVLGHEAGHGAFVANKTVNDIVGYIAHHYLMVPYFNWQYSHGVHHRRTNHLPEGETHVPNELSEVLGSTFRIWLASNAPRFVNQLVGVTLFLTLGWPAYMLLHLTGSRSRREAGAHHFKLDPLFHKSVHFRVMLSNIGIVAGCCLLAVLCYKFGLVTMAKMYGGPWLVVHMWLVLLTFIHHSHPTLPHFRKESPQMWTWLKGAMCTVDSNYGAILDHIHHDIGNTHLVHHIFSGMPWYHQREATRHVLNYLNERGCGHLYTYNPNPFRTLWEYSTELWYVDDDGDIVFYKSDQDACAEFRKLEAKGASGKAAPAKATGKKLKTN